MENIIKNNFNYIKQTYLEIYKKNISQKKYLIDTPNGSWFYSNPNIIFHLFNSLKFSYNSSFIDLGSGDGLVINIASLFFKKITGVEIDKNLYLLSKKITKKLDLKINKKISQKVELINKDFNLISLKKYNLLFINPDKHFKYFEKKLIEEMNKESILIVYNNIFLPRFLKLKKKITIKQIQISFYSK